MRYFVLLVLALSLVAADRPVKRKILGKVNLSGTAEVTSGDSMIVFEGKERRKIRLEGIDAPELTQEMGLAAQKNISSLTAGTPKRFEWTAVEDDGTFVGDLFVVHRDGTEDNVALKQLEAGMAWHLPKDKRKEFSEAEEAAKKDKLGIWKNPKPTPPWVYRKKAARGE